MNTICADSVSTACTAVGTPSGFRSPMRRIVQALARVAERLRRRSIDADEWYLAQSNDFDDFARRQRRLELEHELALSQLRAGLRNYLG